jgi:hypothetical protein
VSYYLTADEQGWVARYGRSALWALKEAAWKALRPGADVPFTAVELRFGSAGAVTAVRGRGTGHPAKAWIVRPWPGYVLAVVLLADGMA